MPVDIVYETHSVTIDNERGFATGWRPGELSAYGRERARDLGVRRRNDGIAAVYSSDLKRAVDTALIAFSGTDIPIRQDRRLRECDYGDLTGRPVQELARQRARRVDEPFPGGQSYRQVVEQTRDFLRDLSTTCDGQRILIIAHSANRLALEHLLHDRDLHELVDQPSAWQEGWSFSLPSGWRG